MMRRDIAQALFTAAGAAAAGAALADTGAGAPTCSAPCYPRTPLETAASVTPSDDTHPPGTPERYGAVGDGEHDDTAAFERLISCNSIMTFGPGKSYAVTTITFKYGPEYFVNFNGSNIKGIATSRTTCVVNLQMQGSTFIGYHVTTYAKGRNPNPNYDCGTWWYNPTRASQYNVFLGMKHSYSVRGMIYGALPGQTSTAVAQSENQIYGWRSRGVQNPFLSNCIQGFLHFSDPIFSALNEEWSVPFDLDRARALEVTAGAVYAQGGEIQAASSHRGFSADLQSCMLSSMNIETANPIQITGDGVQIIGGHATVDGDSTPAFKVKSGVNGLLSLCDTRFSRIAPLGSYSATPLVDATAAGADFETLLADTKSVEWRWNLIGGDARLVRGGQVRYRNHRMKITAADPNTYILDSSPSNSLLDGRAFDRLGYSTTGWHLQPDPGNRSTVATVARGGPPGYLGSHLELVANGTAAVLTADLTSLETLRATAMPVAPCELFWLSCWMKTTAGANAKLLGRGFDLGGRPAGEVVVADAGALKPGSWTFVEGPLPPGQTAAYLAPGLSATNGSVEFTDLRIRRAT